jgi:hypothetical protein
VTAAKGFTVLELTLGATLVLIISSVAMGVLLSVQSVQRDAQVKSLLTRDAQFVLDTLARDFSYIGMGVPRGNQIYGAAKRLRPPILIGKRDYIAFVGDLPYPNADVNGAAVLQNVGNPLAPPCPSPGFDLQETKHQMHVTSELALCTPPDAAPTTGEYTCESGKRRLIDVGSAANCDNSNKLTAATCPWSLGKWQGDNGSPVLPVTLIIATPVGSWVRRRVDNFTTGLRDGLSVHLLHDYPSDSNPAPNPAVCGGGYSEQKADLLARDFIQRRSGASLIAQLDRVFYSLEKLNGSACGTTANCVLRRRQCWGWRDSLDPTTSTFPPLGAPAILSNAAVTAISSCSPPNEGTGWEPIMHGVSKMELRYFQSAAPDTPAIAVGGALNANTSEDTTFIEIMIELARSLPGATPASAPLTLTQKFTRRVFLDDGGGPFVDNTGVRLEQGAALPGVPYANDISAANGGCETSISCGRP